MSPSPGVVEAVDGVPAPLLFDALPDAVLLVAADGRVIHANTAAERLFGAPREALAGVRAALLFPPAARDDLDRRLRAYLDDPRLQPTIGRLETVAVDPRGGERPVDVALGAAELGGRPVVALVASDAGDRRRLEHELLRAERLEALGRVAGGAAHDFNNVLTAIGAWVDAARSDLRRDPEGALAALEEAADAVDRAAGMTRRLLGLSRGGRPVLQPVDVDALVRGTHRLLARLAGDGVRVVVETGGAPSVAADPSQLEQALINLVVNARDAMPGGGTVTVATSAATLGPQRPGLPPGRYAVVRVTDEGLGMTPAVRERAFEPFFTTKPAGRGTGLGLATVHGIVSALGGDVRLYAESPHGTTAKLFLPALPPAG